MVNKMNKSILIILVLCISVWSDKKICTSDTFKNIQSKSISEMSDGEYRIFDDSDEKCIKCDPCKDKYITEIKDKSISQMTTNEYDYFSDHFWDCDSIKPCSLKQFIEIKDKKEIEMTNNEYDFYKDCKDECKSYQDHHLHNSRRIWVGILLGLGGALVLVAAGWPFYRPR
jgi:hypothetical protein